MKRFLPLLALLLAPPAWAEPPAVVAELFTSQSCSSCPPAEAWLGELAKQPGLVALEWHVSYWNDLVAGGAGRWADPFSARPFTLRQRGYAAALGEGGRVYTPQMVVDGRAEAVGSDRPAVRRLVAAARARPHQLTLAIAAAPGGGYVATLAGPPTGAPLWLVGLVEREATRVTGGENAGRRLVNHRIVRSIERIGRDGAADRQVRFALPAGADACAVLVQAEGPGPVLAAAACPAGRERAVVP